MRRTLILCALAVLAPSAWLLAGGSASGQPPTAPVATTSAATAVTASGATLNGTVNPNGQATSYAFQWGPTAGYGHEAPLPPGSAGSGTAAVPESAALSGLASGTVYHFRVIAFSAGGVATGADQTFTTPGTAPPPSTPPTATTGSASGVAQASATLSGTVNPNGQATSDYFEYGTTANYGLQTPAVNAGSGTTDTPASADLTGLSSSTTYHYRLVAVSAGGTTLGADQTLTTTTPPTVTTIQASSIREMRATLNGTVNPQDQSTTYDFEFGTTSSYGLQSPPAGVGSGSSPVAVNATIAGLLPGTTYHYRLVAQNGGGISYGTDQSFKTSGGTLSPSQIQVVGKTGFVSTGGFVGVTIPCFGLTRCTGRITLSRGSATLSARNFNEPGNSGGLQILRLSPGGRSLLIGGRWGHHVLAQLVVTDTAGQHTSQFINLVPWH